MVNISVVIPLYNEEESLPELAEWLVRVLDANKFSYEILFIDDGSKDNSWPIIQRLAAINPCIKGFKFRRNYGKSAALNVGFNACLGEVVITMDADMQDSPDEIPDLYKMVKEDGFHLVSGWKKKRHDPLSKTIPTKLFNWATRKMSGIYNLHDFNCGLKAYHYNVVKNIEVHGEMHRYIPVIAKWAGFTKITEKAVEHRARKYGITKFGWERFINGFLDLVSLTFVSRFGKRPMHLFGSLGVLSFMAGFFIAAYLAFAKIFWLEYKMTERPLFYFGLLAMIVGTQLFLTGFVSEMIARNAVDRNNYQIEEKTDGSKIA
jgi:glycosyltransferase involved in cell wall biosynthesis